VVLVVTPFESDAIFSKF